MMGAENPRNPMKSAETMGGSPVTFYLYFENAEGAFKQAVDAGAQVVMPITDMFWGDRVGQVRDPFGHHWFIATHVKDMTEQEMKKGAEEVYAGAKR
jgi:PhnB protein